MKYKVAMAQLSPVLGRVEENVRKALQALDEASSEGCDLIVFPEMFLTGYSIEPKALSNEARQIMEEKVENGLAALSRASEKTGMDVLVSYPRFMGNKGTYIAASYFSRGECLGTHLKVNLCNYAHYTEHLNFEEGDSLSVIDTPLGKVGVLICEDCWHVENAMILAHKGAQIIMIVSAASVLSPEEAPVCMRVWEDILKGSAITQTCDILLVNRVGNEGNSVFAGGSMAISSNGEVFERLPFIEGSVGICEFDTANVEAMRERRPLLNNTRLEMCQKQWLEICKEKKRHSDESAFFPHP